MAQRKKAKAPAKKLKPLSRSFKTTMARFNAVDKQQQKRLLKLKQEADKKGYNLIFD